MYPFLPKLPSTEISIRKKTRDLANGVLRSERMLGGGSLQFSRAHFDTFAAEGLTAIVTPKEFGGLGLGYREYYAVIEELARASAAMAVTVGVNHLPQGALRLFGSKAQKDSILRVLASGQALGAFSLSEPGSGSDAASLVCSAKRVKEGYELNGTKAWCTSGGVADYYLLMARTGEDKTKGISAFIVSKETPGFTVGKQEHKLGLTASPTTELVFEKCVVPDTQLVGEEGDGLKVALSQLDGGRVVIGTIGLGLALEAARNVWKEVALRKAKGAALPFGWETTWSRHFAQMQAVRSLVCEAARCADAGESITTIASQVKLLGSDLAMHVTSDAVSFFGMEGVRPSRGLERLMRDAKALQIVEGTNQIQEVVLARRLEALGSADETL